MKYLRFSIIGLFILATSNFAFSQYTYCMCKYAIEMKNGTIIKGYKDDDCKYKEDTLFQIGNDITTTIRNKWKQDTLEVYTSLYSYSYTSKDPYDDSLNLDRNYYWNKKAIVYQDIKSIIYQGQIFESTLSDVYCGSNFEKDTLWMKIPSLDSYPLDLQLQINNRFFLEKKC